MFETEKQTNNNIDTELNNLNLNSLKTGASFKLDIESKKKALLVEIRKTTGTEQDELKARYGHLSLTDENCNKFPELKDIREKYNAILKERITLENDDDIKKSTEELLKKAYDIMRPETKVILSIPNEPINLEKIEEIINQWTSEHELPIENLKVSLSKRLEVPSYLRYASPNWQLLNSEYKTYTEITFNVGANEINTEAALRSLEKMLNTSDSIVNIDSKVIETNPKKAPLFPKELL